ncbi:MAG: c-type cytochrome [Gammaproteobacteria bacterium]|nr:c-type cytochrome [Gammaproteobacteria bacterium]
MMRHPAVHIALIVLIALVLTLVARGCDGDHESELPAEERIPEAPLAAPVEPSAAAPELAPQKTKAAIRFNPCIKQSPAPAPMASFPTPAEEAGEREPAAPATAAPPPATVAPAETRAMLKGSAGGRHYAKGSKPCIKQSPTPVASVPAPAEQAGDKSSPEAATAGQPRVAEAPAKTPATPKRSVSVMPYKTGGSPRIRQSPTPVASSPVAPSPAPSDEAGEREPVAPARPRQSRALEVPADTRTAPKESVSVMPYARLTNPGAKGPPVAHTATAPLHTPAPRADEATPAPPGESARVSPPTRGANPCLKGPPARAVAPARPSVPTGGVNEGATLETVRADRAIPPQDKAGTATEQSRRSTGGGPLLASSLDDGSPVTRRIMRGAGETQSPPPSLTARLAASMDDGVPAAPRERHQHQHKEGIEHDHDTAPGGGESAPEDHSRHVAKMKAGRHTDLSHLRIDPPVYPAPEKYHPGRNLYQAHCESCHGDRGTGSDNAPPLLHPYYDPNLHGDDYFYNAVANGAQQHLWDYGDMPPLPHVNREQVGEIISYVRWLQRQANIY